MNKFFLITKVNLQSFFNLRKFANVPNKNFFKNILVIAVIVYLSWYVYWMASLIMPSFVILNSDIYMLGMLFSITSIFILLNSIFKIKNILFDFKDYDFLMSLPINRNLVLLSKLSSLYVLNLLYTFIIMIPGYIAYYRFTDNHFFLKYFVLILVVPIIPIVLSTIISILLSWLTSAFKNKKIGSYIVNFSLVIIYLLISFKINSMDEISIASGGISIVNRLNVFYPLTNIFMKLLTNFNIIDCILYYLIPIIFLVLLVFIVNYSYSTIRNNLLKTSIKDDYIVKSYRYKVPLASLYNKELKKFTSNSLYVLNTLFASFMLLMMVLAIILFKDDYLSRLLSISNIGDFLSQYVILIICLCVAMSSTTHPSISLEGKSLWIMKMIPVNTNYILLSKVLVNLTFVVPIILITSTFFGIYLHFELGNFILLYLLPLLYIVLVSIVGLILNLWFPRFDYDSEMKVIKQSLPAFLNIFIGIFSVIVPFGLTNFNSFLYAFILLLIDILLYFYLRHFGKNKFAKL